MQLELEQNLIELTSYLLLNSKDSLSTVGGSLITSL